MEIILEFGKILLPAGLVLYAMYLTMKSILAKEIVKANMDYKIEGSKITLPNRLQAFERICLFWSDFPLAIWCCGSMVAI